jgi:outer membrane protein assembly factor BamD
MGTRSPAAARRAQGVTDLLFTQPSTSEPRRQGRTGLVLLVLALTVAGCGGNQGLIPSGVTDPDRYLFERGQEALAESHWLDAREYFGQIIDNYPQSTRRATAKLGVADAFFGESSAESLILAANEYSEFLRFYPTHERADYAQYRLAMTSFEQMRAPERDQTNTRDALRELDVFRANYPQSDLLPEVEMKWREARNLLSEATYLVGRHNLRRGAYRGAFSRFQEVLEDDPGYARRDLLYFYLAETWTKSDNPNTEADDQNTRAQAIQNLERLLDEFPESDRRDEAAQRLEDLKAR